VVLRHLDGFLRSRLCGAAAPQPVLGFTPFQGPTSRVLESFRDARSPPRRAIPFGAFPSQAAVPRHRGRCPHAVPLTSRLQGLALSANPLRTPISRRPRARCSLGLSSPSRFAPDDRSKPAKRDVEARPSRGGRALRSHRTGFVSPGRFDDRGGSSTAPEADRVCPIVRVGSRRPSWGF
jgi:hypothetical protein